MKEAFDDLTKALASGMSRADALRRFGVAVGGSLLFFRHSGAAHAGESSDCKRFCKFVYGDGTAAYDECWTDAKRGRGVCYEFGPKSKECRSIQCPPHSFCVSHNFNFNYTGVGPGGHCVPTS
jgi:hypothetical protein